MLTLIAFALLDLLLWVTFPPAGLFLFLLIIAALMIKGAVNILWHTSGMAKKYPND